MPRSIRICRDCGILLTAGRADHVRRNDGYICVACYNRNTRSGGGMAMEPARPVAAAGSRESRVLAAAARLAETRAARQAVEPTPKPAKPKPTSAPKPAEPGKMYTPVAFEDGTEFEVVGDGIEDMT